MCDRIGCLPYEGGLFDQNPRHIKRMEKVYHAQYLKESEDIEIEKNKRNT